MQVTDLVAPGLAAETVAARIVAALGEGWSSRTNGRGVSTGYVEIFRGPTVETGRTLATLSWATEGISFGVDRYGLDEEYSAKAADLTAETLGALALVWIAAARRVGATYVAQEREAAAARAADEARRRKVVEHARVVTAALAQYAVEAVTSAEFAAAAQLADRPASDPGPAVLVAADGEGRASVAFVNAPLAGLLLFLETCAAGWNLHVGREAVRGG